MMLQELTTGSDAGGLASSIWEQADTFRVRRQPPDLDRARQAHPDPIRGDPRRRIVRRAAAAVLLALALTLAGCASGDDAGGDRVRAVILPYLTNVPLQIAAEEGFFAAENLDVEFSG